MTAIHENGYWEGQEASCNHIHDECLASALVDFFKHEKAQKVADFGCGMGDSVV